MLEDELTSVLADDDDIKQLIIVDSTEQQELARKLRSQNRPFLIKDFEGAFDLVKKHRQGAHSSGHLTKGVTFFSSCFAVEAETISLSLSTFFR
jgi:hypothetical protein